MFDGFAEWDVDLGGVTVHGRSGGSGPPVLLLHGHPRTHTTWYRVAPLLVAAGHTVVCADLPGYGRSSSPDDGDFTKRAMAGHLLAVMRELGHPRFAVAGHDRGSYVAYRLALDAPDAVTAVAVLDCVPLAEALARADARFAQAWWHWFFFAQPDKPERAILAEPNAWYRNTAEAMGEQNWADYQRAIHDPDTVHAMLEDYRAGLGPDREHDEADRAAARTIGCPVLAAWSAHDDMADLYGDVLAVWRPWAPDLRGAVIDSGHHMAEQAPEQLAGVLADFVAGRLPAVPAPEVLGPRALFERLLACRNEGRLAELGRWVADDVRVDGEPVGLPGYAERLAARPGGGPWRVVHLLVDGDLLSAHLRRGDVREFTVHRVRAGRIVESWGGPC